MSNVLRRNRKGSDEDITRLNRLGLSLATIAKKLDCHPTSVTLRLKSLNVPPANTRRAFMEDIYNSLPTAVQDALEERLLVDGKPVSIKEHVRELIIQDALNQPNYNKTPQILES